MGVCAEAPKRNNSGLVSEMTQFRVQTDPDSGGFEAYRTEDLSAWISDLSESVGMGKALYQHSTMIFGKRPRDLRRDQLLQLIDTFLPMVKELKAQVDSCRTVH